MLLKQLTVVVGVALLLTGCKDRNEAPSREDVNSSAYDSSFNQGETQVDRNVTQNIRQALMRSDSLSTNAKNVKIITKNGIVTLRGPVNNGNEKIMIIQIAKKVNGVNRVNDEIEVSAFSY